MPRCITQAFVQRGSAYAPGGTTFNFEADSPELDFYAQDAWQARNNLTAQQPNDRRRYAVRGEARAA